MKKQRGKIIIFMLIAFQIGLVQAQDLPTKDLAVKKFELRPNSRDQAPVRHSNFKQRMVNKAIMAPSQSVNIQKSRPEIKPNKNAINKQLKMIQKHRQAVVRRNFRR